MFTIKQLCLDSYLLKQQLQGFCFFHFILFVLLCLAGNKEGWHILIWRTLLKLLIAVVSLVVMVSTHLTWHRTKVIISLSHDVWWNIFIRVPKKHSVTSRDVPSRNLGLLRCNAGLRLGIHSLSAFVRQAPFDLQMFSSTVLQIQHWESASSTAVVL